MRSLRDLKLFKSRFGNIVLVIILLSGMVGIFSDVSSIYSTNKKEIDSFLNQWFGVDMSDDGESREMIPVAE